MMGSMKAYSFLFYVSRINIKTKLNTPKDGHKHNFSIPSSSSSFDGHPSQLIFNTSVLSRDIRDMIKIWVILPSFIRLRFFWKKTTRPTNCSLT